MKLKLYILSLWLLFFLIIILTIDIPVYFGPDWSFVDPIWLVEKNLLPLACLFFILLGYIFFKTFDYKLKGSTSLPGKLSDVTDANFEHLSFLATYILPLIGFNLSEPRSVVVLFSVLTIIGSIYIRTNIFFANPTLALIGFKLYRAKIIIEGERKDIMLITRNELDENDFVKTIKLDKNIYYARKE